MAIEEIVEYTVKIRKHDKNLYYYSITEGGIETSGQAMGIGQAMNLVSEIVYARLENEGRVK
jgi:hypothetical protein